MDPVQSAPPIKPVAKPPERKPKEAPKGNGEVLQSLAGDLPRIRKGVTSRPTMYFAAIVATGFLYLGDVLKQAIKSKD